MERFYDDNYRNWIKTTASINTLRVGLQTFLENETETYHSFLKSKLGNRFKDATCGNKCDGKKWKKPDCEVCTPWKKEIFDNHREKRDASVYWINCRPHMWPKEKWEVAKVYMPRGHREHTIYDDFDIAAVLNLMGQCNHFRKFIKHPLPINQVINVRNCVMHSPNLTVNQKDFEQHLQKMKDLARLLDKDAHDLKSVPDEIDELCRTIDVGFVIELQSGGQKQVEREKNPFLKRMELELKALEEKIQYLSQRCEEDQEGVKEEVQGIWNFLNENTDLKEKLAPQMEQLQRRVDQHEQQINVLNERVDQLEVKVTQGPEKDLLFPTSPLKYKNYIFELARKYGWPDPVFTESLEQDGYRGRLEVNGLTFTGERVCLNKKLAHQEVAKKAMDHLQTLAASAGEGGQMRPAAAPSESSTSEGCMSGQDLVKTVSQYYYGSVTVVLDTEVASEEGCCQEKEAIEAAYGKLALLFGLDDAETGSSKKALVLEHFQARGFPPPLEDCNKCPDEKFYCKLTVSGPFTFHDQEWSTKKKQAEQQAAKTALQQLSRVLKWTPSGDNYKSALKERLEAMGMGQPSYDVTKREEASGEEQGFSDRRALVTVKEPIVINMEVCSSEPDTHQEVSDRSILGVSGEGVKPESVMEESTSASVEASGSLYYGSVKVTLDTEFEDQEWHLQEGEAIESAYMKLAESFGLENTKPGSSRAVVQMYFERYGYSSPVEKVQKHLDDCIRCNLKLSGSFTFLDQDGSTKKKQAMQQAAKTALQQLSRVLKWTPSGDNYIGALKERLEALGLGQPSYDATKREGVSVEESGHSAVTSFGSEPAGNSNTDPPPEDASPPDFKEQLKSQPRRPAADAAAAAAPEIHTTESSPTPVHRKQAKVEFPEVEKLLVVWGLLPPVVMCEKCSVEQRFMCSVRVQLDGYTFQAPGSFKTKKEASRKAFHSFALAAEICQPGADETGSTQAVKQYFAQRSQPCPKEEYGKEGKENAFSCSLTDVACSLVYEGQGSSEGEARQAAFLNAFTKLSRLFSASGTPGALGVVDDRLTTLLKMAGQAEPVYSLKAQRYKASIQLKFSGYRLENKSTTNKKQARNYLSARILKMLGVDTDASTSGSLRNSLDEWFKRRKLPGPDFEELKEPLGVQVTFSAPFSCSSPDWEDTWAHAERSLVQELSARFTWNKEDGTAGSGSSSL